MMTAYRTYPRGFVFSSRKVALPESAQEHFQEVSLPGHFFAFDSWTRVGLKVDGSDFVVIVGHALHVGSEGSSSDLDFIAAQLFEAAASRTGALHEYLYELGGRYAIVVHNGEGTRVYHDAHGVRTVYSSSATGVISSHLDLLIQDTSHPPSGHPSQLCDLSGQWEFTKYLNITALLPNHWLNPGTGVQTRFFPQSTNRFQGMSTEDRLKEIVRLWHGQMELIVAMGHPIAFSMTGGLDSKTLLALSRPYLKSLEAFTYTTEPKEGKWSQSLALDAELVTQITKIVEVPHRFLNKPTTPSDPSTKAAESAILSRNSISSHGRWILPLYKNAFPDPRTIHLRGNLLETARRYYSRRGDEGQSESLNRILMSFARKGTAGKPPSVVDEIANMHADRVRRSGLAQLPQDYEPLDFLYWEIRMGRWVAEVANETDVAFDTFMPFNMRRIVDLFLADPEAERAQAVMSHELINREYPVLNFFGVNTRTNLYESSHPNRRSSPPQGDDAGHQFKPRLLLTRSHATESVDLEPSSKFRLAAEDVIAGSELSALWEFEAGFGAAHFTLRNRYRSLSGRNRVALIVAVGSQEVLEEDIADWAQPSRISIYGLTRGARIRVALRVLKTSVAESWSRATATEITEYEEVRLGKPDAVEPAIIAGSSSPFARKVSNSRTF